MKSINNLTAGALDARSSRSRIGNLSIVHNASDGKPKAHVEVIMKKKHLGLKYTGICIVIFIAIVIVSGLIGRYSSGGDTTSTDRSAKVSKSSVKKSAHKKKSNSNKSLVSKKQIWKNLQEQLANCQENSNGLITKAEIKNNALYLTVNDDILNGTDAEVKNSAKEAWNWGNKQHNYFTPLPEGKWDTNLIFVETPSGDRLAQTSVSEQFKYLGNN